MDGRPLFLQLVNAPLDLLEALVLDQRLVDDAFEVGAVALVAAGEDAVDDVRDLHRLGRSLHHALDGFGEAVLVAGPRAAAAAPAEANRPAAHARHLAVERAQSLLELR